MNENAKQDEALSVARWLVADALRVAGGGAMTMHPDADELVAYQEGALEPAPREAVRRHVEQCGRCADEVEKLEYFDSLAGASEVDDERLPSGKIIRQDWLALQQRLAEEEVDDDGRDAAVGGPSRSYLLALAATLAVLTLGIALLLPRPESDDGVTWSGPLLLKLVPDGEIPIRAAVGHPVALDPRVDLLILQLGVGDLTAYPAYFVEIDGPDGESVWRSEAVERQPDGGFVALVSRRDLPEGALWIRLVAEAEGGETSLATYSIELRRSED